MVFVTIVQVVSPRAVSWVLEVNQKRGVFALLETRGLASLRKNRFSLERKLVFLKESAGIYLRCGID